MQKVSDILKALERHAPYTLGENWDNNGLLAGHSDSDVNTVLVSLDITCAVIAEAAALGAQLIVSHHPLAFDFKSVTDLTAAGRRMLALAEHKIAAVCMHTNLDCAAGGVNDSLAEAIGMPRPFEVLQVTGKAGDGNPLGFGRAARLEKGMTLTEFARKVKQKLNSGCLRVHDAGREVRYAAVNSGSGGDCIPQVLAAGCDTFVTGDVKHHTFLEAQEFCLNLIDAGHFATENVVCRPLMEFLTAEFPELSISLSKVSKEPFVCL